MVSRYLWACFVALLLSAQTGCHCSGCWPCGKNWCGGSCCETFCHEWFSLPPDCCDPCTNCGAFLGPNNRFLRRGVFAAHGGAIGPYYDDGYTPASVQQSPTVAPQGPASQPTPTPAREQLPAGDLPASDEFRTGEELPPIDTSSDYRSEDDDRGYRSGDGRPASYDRQVDSRRPSRTLGRPYPARRYAR